MENLNLNSKPPEQQKRGYPKPSKPITLDKNVKLKPPDVNTELTLKEAKAFLLKALSNETASLFFGTSNSWDRWLRIIIVIVVLVLMTINSIF
jgi:hypothetical protein